MSAPITATVSLWRWRGGAQGGDWHFVSIDGAGGEALSAHALAERLETGRRRGFGSVRVRVTVGASTWDTSAFPMQGRGWSIPVKAAVRRAEGLAEGDPVSLAIQPL